MPLVTPEGFAPVEPIEFAPASSLPSEDVFAIDLPVDTNLENIAPHFDHIQIIRIPVSKFGDGRGFSLAQRLRDLGYQGRIRAHGHMISDQFRYALECGISEVEIDDDLAKRQPQELWQPNPLGQNYQERLMGKTGRI